MTDDFRLAGWIIRPQRDCIERDGEIVHVKPKAMAVLGYLVDAAGEVVTRDELFKAVWPNGEVSDDALTQCIVALRKAFRDSARKPGIIETIPKVGFRIIPPAERLVIGSIKQDTVEPVNAKTRPYLVIVGLMLLAFIVSWYLLNLQSSPTPRSESTSISIAVLPFVDMSADGDQGYFADGLTEELITRLAQLQGLEVAGRTSSFYFKGKNEALPGIARALGVNHLLEGSVRRDEDRLRITAQLIDASNGFHLWSRQFDRPFSEIFNVQEEIAGSVADALSIKLQIGDLGTVPGGTSSVEAYEEILLSKRYQWESTPESIVTAIDHARNAIEIDPDYANAWFRLAGLYINANGLLGTEDAPGAYLKSEQALDEAQKLVPDMPGIIPLRVMIHNKKRQWSAVEHTMNRGTGLQYSTDGDLISVYAGFLYRMGRIREAIPLFERVRSLQPFSSKNARALGSVYIIEGRIEEGLAETEHAFKMEGFESWDVENGMLTALSTNNRDVLLKWLERAKHYMPASADLIGAMQANLDDSEAALEWLRNEFRQVEKDDCLITFWAAWHADTSLALDSLKRCPSPFFFWHRVMGDVRRTEGFKDLIRESGMEEYYREFGWNDFCQPLGSEDFECE
jgi:TolB-like protein/DNA-binding winged helix-turn-helix (wHTH) protein